MSTATVSPSTTPGAIASMKPSAIGVSCIVNGSLRSSASPWSSTNAASVCGNPTCCGAAYAPSPTCGSATSLPSITIVMSSPDTPG